ncbi:MAG TPA: erythromycin esterase family protein [Terriglobia bacterium]|nr:erythromycin esterase family protein [Terriglobia bacterium]
MDRRHFVGTLAITGLARGSAQELRAQDAPAQDVTRTIAHWIFTSKPEETTPAARKEAARTLLNWVACAVGGFHHESVDATLSTTLVGTSPVVVWAHNSHLGDARSTAMGRRGEWNIGQLTRERY